MSYDEIFKKFKRVNQLDGVSVVCRDNEADLKTEFKKAVETDCKTYPQVIFGLNHPMH